jgi:small conductance mechanosensitive channel
MMQWIEDVRQALPNFVAATIGILTVVVSLWAANWVLLRRNRDLGEERRFPRRITMIVIAIVGVVVIILLLPIAEARRDNLVTMVGLIVTVAIALGSTTFVSNAMAGLMLRTVRAFRPGDFVRVGEHFGRVTERGLFHTEIQTEDRDLTTLPNLFLVSNPVRVVRKSGTIVSATVSLGYEVPQQKICKWLIEAAQSAELTDPFVQIRELGDFSVLYRVAGFLGDVKQLITARSSLRSRMIEKLHTARVEIVSPTHMIQRPIETGYRHIPPTEWPPPDPKEMAPEQLPEKMIFDKAEEAERIEHLRIEREALVANVAELDTAIKTADEKEQPKLERRRDILNRRCQRITDQLLAHENAHQE